MCFNQCRTHNMKYLLELTTFILKKLATSKTLTLYALKRKENSNFNKFVISTIVPHYNFYSNTL